MEKETYRAVVVERSYGLRAIKVIYDEELYADSGRGYFFFGSPYHKETCPVIKEMLRHLSRNERNESIAAVERLIDEYKPGDCPTVVRDIYRKMRDIVIC